MNIMLRKVALLFVGSRSISLNLFDRRCLTNEMQIIKTTCDKVSPISCTGCCSVFSDEVQRSYESLELSHRHITCLELFQLFYEEVRRFLSVPDFPRFCRDLLPRVLTFHILTFCISMLFIHYASGV